MSHISVILRDTLPVCHQREKDIVYLLNREKSLEETKTTASRLSQKDKLTSWEKALTAKIRGIRRKCNQVQFLIQTLMATSQVLAVQVSLITLKAEIWKKTTTSSCTKQHRGAYSLLNVQLESNFQVLKKKKEMILVSHRHTLTTRRWAINYQILWVSQH